MSALPHLIAFAVAVTGAAYLYLGAPRQQWLTRPWPAGISRFGGLALLGLSWLIWAAALRPTTAFFVVLTVAMAALTVLPAAAALWRRPARAS
jgi:hypothetical protein